MTDLHDNNNDYNASDYWKDLIANLDGSYEEYKMMREILFKDDYERWFERNSNADTMKDYLMSFDDVVEYLDYLDDIAHDIEDYEFCAVLKIRKLWAHWKNTTIEKALVEQMEYKEVDIDPFIDL